MNGWEHLRRWIETISFSASALLIALAVVIAMKGVNRVTASAAGTLNAINAPCVGFHGSVTCGPLAQLSQTEKNIGILAAQSALQVKQSSKLVDASAKAVTSAAGDVHNLSTAAQGTLGAATGAVQSIKEDADASRPLLAAATITVAKLGTAEDDLSGILADNRTRIALTLDSVNGIAGNFRATTGMVNTYLQPILAPKPCPKRHHLGCELRRHTLGYLSTGARFGESIYWTRANF